MSADLCDCTFDAAGVRACDHCMEDVYTGSGGTWASCDMLGCRWRTYTVRTEDKSRRRLKRHMRRHERPVWAFLYRLVYGAPR